MARNPYRTPPPAQEGEAPDPSGEFRLGGPGAYSVPDIPSSTDPDYTTSYSPTLDVSNDGDTLPDSIRIGKREPPPNDPNNRDYNRKRKANFKRRHSVEEYVIGWDIKQEGIPRPRVPEWEQDILPSRPTADNSPLGYAFRRPWHIPRNIRDAVGEDAETHVSLADHRRTYEIYGMQPRGILGRNTFRLEPEPWDEDFYYAPPASEDNAQPTPAFSAGRGNRAFRAG